MLYYELLDNHNLNYIFLLPAAAAPTRHAQTVQSSVKALASAAHIIILTAGRPVGVYDDGAVVRLKLLRRLLTL